MTDRPIDPYWRRARVLRWLDGDTLDVWADLGFSIGHEVRVRLIGSRGGVNTPELHDKDPAERARARIALARVVEIAPPGTDVMIRTEQDRVDGFRRYLAEVVCADGTNVGDTLLAEGKAEVWTR